MSLRDLFRPLLILAAIAAVMYVACCAALFEMQRSMIYTPDRSGADHGENTFSLKVDGERVVVSSQPCSGPNAIIYFGGNAENVSESMPTLQRAFPDSSLFALHYRGYNGSTGTPSEKALIADALLLYDLVCAKNPHISLIGRSLGSGVAIHVASLRNVDRLVLVTPYYSLQEIAAQRMPFFPVHWMMQDKYESWRYAPHVSAPTLLLAAEYDEVIPAASTDRLFKALPASSATLVTVLDAGHNTISLTSEYITLLRGPP